PANGAARRTGDERRGPVAVLRRIDAAKRQASGPIDPSRGDADAQASPAEDVSETSWSRAHFFRRPAGRLESEQPQIEGRQAQARSARVGSGRLSPPALRQKAFRTRPSGRPIASRKRQGRERLTASEPRARPVPCRDACGGDDGGGGGGGGDGGGGGGAGDDDDGACGALPSERRAQRQGRLPARRRSRPGRWSARRRRQ